MGVQVNLADSSFVANNASYGGGMACYDCNMSVKGVVFTENSADVTGGGLLAVHEANVSIWLAQNGVMQFVQ